VKICQEQDGAILAVSLYCLKVKKIILTIFFETSFRNYIAIFRLNMSLTFILAK